MAELAVGQEAPDFTLPDETNHPVHLADLRGQTAVLMFYPLDFSGVCTGEFCEIRDRYSDIESAGARLFGISRDSHHSHRVFKQQEGFKHTLLSDMKGDVARQYGAWNENSAFAERLTVVIDKNGKINFMDRSPAVPTARDQQKMIDAIKKLAA